MNEQAMSQALDAIHTEAVKLAQLDLPPQAKQSVELIISLARYEHDVRTAEETGEADDAEAAQERHLEEMRDSADPRIWPTL